MCLRLLAGEGCVGRHSWSTGDGTNALAKDGRNGFMFDVSVERRPRRRPPSRASDDGDVAVVLHDIKVAACARVHQPGFAVEVYLAKDGKSYVVRGADVWERVGERRQDGHSPRMGWKSRKFIFQVDNRSGVLTGFVVRILI